MRSRGEAVERLYELQYRPLLGLGRLLVGGDAEDLVQEAFVRALDRWRPGAPDEAFRAWAQTTMVRLSISRWRRANREHEAWAHAGSDAVVAGRDPIPEVARALEALTPRQRAAVILRYYLDLTEREIAARMGVRVGTVKALLHQARARLRLDPTLVAS